jgi:hypothetical protein
MGRRTIDTLPTPGQRHRGGKPLSRATKLALTTVGALSLIGAGLAGCSAAQSGSSAAASSAPALAASSNQASAGSSVADPYQKVLVVMEENETYGAVLSSAKAPYLTSLSQQYGTATAFDAGYPVQCTSLASYLLLTSGDRRGICDDNPPSAHPDPSSSIFAQATSSGRTWRTYAESMPSNCDLTNSGDYAVRHVPATYYTGLRSQCVTSAVPMGTMSSGAFHTDLSSGNLPAYSMLVPNLCDDMHGATNCPAGNMVTEGDTWLHNVLPAVFASPDYRAGRLVVMIDWDEGDSTSNHIPALVLSPTTKHVAVTAPMTDCSMLALSEDVLGLNRLGCAVGEPRRLAAFHLGA